jgi:hypothetical protein
MARLQASLAIALVAFAVAAAGCGGTSTKSENAKPLTPVFGDGGIDPALEARAYIDCTKTFRVDFPPLATGATLHETIDEGVRAEMIMRTGPSITYSVTWAELPPAMVEEKGAKRVLADARDSRLGKTGTLDDEHEVTIADAKAIEMSFHRLSAVKDQPPGGRVLLALKGTTLYQVAALGGVDAGKRDDAKEFLGSFRILKCD